MIIQCHLLSTAHAVWHCSSKVNRTTPLFQHQAIGHDKRFARLRLWAGTMTSLGG